MNGKLSGAALAAFVCLGGCAPLSQAGLVYSSRAQVGVNVAAGTPETPGLNLNIGMNVNDSAYIPVVVGRPCELGNRTTCNDRLVLVRGNNDVGDSQSSDDDDHAPVPGNGNGNGNGGTPPVNPGTKAAQPAPAPAPAAAAAQQAAQQAAADAERAAARAQKIISQSSNRRGDALSVYGTFDSNGTASAPGNAAQGTAGLRLGRIFSTGVASQNLTEGQRDALRADALTRCMAEATASTAAGDVRNQLLSACAATVGRR